MQGESTIRNLETFSNGLIARGKIWRTSMQQDINFVKANANVAEEFLAGHGIKVKHGVILDMLARMAGYRNWSTYRAQLALTPAVSNPPTMQQALTMCYRWMCTAPIDELEAVESALGENAPMGMAAEALKAGAAPAAAKDASKAAVSQWAPAMGVMTDEQYLARRGRVCPSCGGSNLSGAGRPDTENCTAWQKISCDDCDATWNDQYRMTGYDYLEGGVDHEAIDEVVDDIKDRAQKYEFSYSSEDQARELIAESCDLLGHHLREVEIELAVKKLVS